MFRVGIGFDIHRLEEGKKLIIGGVEIPFEKGWVAHSDGDIFFHALTDAILGALGEGDIGELFPDTKEENKNKSSDIFLKEAIRIMEENGYEIENIDAYILLQKPKLLPYRQKIIQNTQKITGCSNIFLKGKTFEKLGDIGQGKAGACEVIVLLKNKFRRRG
ncbi:MAG: 2-C-methyl-D-erythritol 2,4-cyclodiphosphate synthase [Hydrogenothermus sp.]|nr:MAG: 2-C-methyl-D-erythritol 2,4-cyclodiphosphate synthase [Hydrogenothermus sp.]